MTGRAIQTMLLTLVVLLVSVPSLWAAMDAMKDDGGMMKKDEMMMDKPMMTEVSGTLTGIDSHTARGLVTLKTGEQDAVLILSGLTIDKVPDGHVILATDGDYRHGLDLGILRQFKGDVRFAVPLGTDLSPFNSVVIWCEQFNVGIGQATLK